MKKEKVKYSSSDFLVTDLPNNRKDLFFDILKNQWRNLLLISFLLFVSLLPLIIVRYSNLMNLSKIIAENKMELYYSRLVAYNVIRVLLYLLIGIVFSGLGRIYKKLSFNDGFFLGADLLKGMKENIKEFSILFISFGIVTLIFDLSAIELAKNSAVWSYLLYIIKYVIVVPVLAITMCLSSIYTDKLFKKIVVSFKLYFKYLPKILLAFLLIGFPLLLILISSPSIQLFIPMLYTLVYLPIAYLAFVIFMNSIFDKEINEKNFPDLVGKGMYKPN